MNAEATRIARHFTTLPAQARRVFLEKLRANKLSFSELPIVPAGREAPLPLSFAQRSLWLTWQIDPASPAYNLPGLLRFTGDAAVTY